MKTIKLANPLLIAKVYEGKKDIVIVFGKDSSGEIHATEISKSSLGASCGFGFDDLKEKRAYIKKNKMKYVGSFNVKEFVWKKK